MNTAEWIALVVAVLFVFAFGMAVGEFRAGQKRGWRD
jgi:hypothetical protein